MQKGQATVLILVGILVILAVVGGAYFLGRSATPKPQPQNQVVTSQTPQPTSIMQPTQTSNDTANWKTYANSKYGFQVGYPPDWLVGEDADKSHNYPYESKIYFRPKSLTVSDPSHGVVSIKIEKKNSVEDSLKSLCSGGYEEPPCDINQAISIQVAGINGKRLNNIKGAVFVDSVFVGRNNYVYRFSTTVGVSNENVNRAILDQILSTFKFTP